MTYRIELTNGRARDDRNEYAYGIEEIKTFLRECVPDGFKVAKIMKTTKDGRATDVTDKYIVR